MHLVYILTHAVVLWHLMCLLSNKSPILNEIKVRIWKMCCLFTRADSAKFDAEVQKQLAELKLYQVRVTLAIGSFALGMVLHLQTIIISEPNPQHILLSSSMLVFYIATVVFTFTSVRLTSWVAELLCNLFMVGIIFRIVLLNQSTYFFLLASVRACTRLVGSLVFLDIRKVIPWNLLISTITCMKYMGVIGVMHKDSRAANELSVFLFVEFSVFTVVLLVAALVQYLLEGRIRAMLEVEGARHGMHKLLGTLCDAVLKLGPELRITTPTPQFLHMLGRHHAGGDVQNVEGTEFITHIASELDQQRFQDFISATTTTSTTWPSDSSVAVASASAKDESGLPAVLHLHLQDAQGSQFPVEVFHAYLPDAEEHQPGHLLGIRVVSELPPAEAPEAADCGIFEHICQGASAAGGDFGEDAAGEHSQAHGGAGSGGEACVDIRQGPASHTEKHHRRRPSSHRSSRSAGSWESISTWQRSPLPQLAGVSFCVDAFDPRLRILSCTLSFVKDHAGAPGLLDWIVGESQAQQFQMFLQTHLNRVAEGCGDDTRVGPVMLQPPALALNGKFHLVSDSVTFSPEGPEGPESDEEVDDENDEPSWPVALKLQNLGHVQKVYTRRLKRPNMSPVIEAEGVPPGG